MQMYDLIVSPGMVWVTYMSNRGQSPRKIAFADHAGNTLDDVG